jgi:cell division protein FtsB
MNFRRATFILVVFLTLAGAHLWVYVQNVGLKYEITDLKIKRAEANSQKRQLAALVAAQENLSSVEKLAREKLGMIYPEKIIYLIASREAAPGRN